MADTATLDDYHDELARGFATGRNRRRANRFMVDLDVRASIEALIELRAQHGLPVVRPPPAAVGPAAVGPAAALLAPFAAIGLQGPANIVMGEAATLAEYITELEKYFEYNIGRTVIRAARKDLGNKPRQHIQRLRGLRAQHGLPVVRPPKSAVDFMGAVGF
jgi:hypothetical protein